jgi:hypothetical protein
MDIDQVIRLPDPRLNVRAEIREVVRDVEERPHVFVRVRLSGWHFPERAPEPFMVIGRAVSKFVVIDRDGTGADGYFDAMPSKAKRISFGYGKIVSWDFDVRIDPPKVPRLDRSRLPRGVVDLREGRPD